MCKLNEFTKAYLECMLWAENDDSTPAGGEPLDRNHTIADLPPETIKRAVGDCKRFQHENCEALIEAIYGTPGHSDATMAGHDFWLTRNGHGAGFWDGDLPEGVGEALAIAARAMGECSPYVGDDGKVYLS